MIKIYSYSYPVPLRSLCRPQKQVSELRDMQSAETQLVNEVSCMARKAGYLAKMLSDKGLCVALIAVPCNLQSQYRGCYLGSIDNRTHGEQLVVHQQFTHSPCSPFAARRFSNSLIHR